MIQIDEQTNQLAYKVIGCAYRVHRELGPGLLENVYETCMCYELGNKDIYFERQKELPVFYDGNKLNCGFRIDILVENKIVLELKTVDELHPIHIAQLMTYIRLSGMHLGYLINFNTVNLQKGIKRYVF